MTHSIWKILLASLLASALIGCSDDRTDDSTEAVDKLAPNTGHIEREYLEVNPQAVFMQIAVSKTYYVYGSQVRARSTPELIDENILGHLFENDEVEIVNPEEINGFVEIKIKKAVRALAASEKIYFAKKYLSETPFVAQPQNEGSTGNERSDVFMVQNVATEILRVYKRKCNDGRCAHEMIFETEIAVGEKKPDTMTALGYFHFSNWVKFYQDGAGSYPSWYDPKYPPMPKPGASVTAWTSKKALPSFGSVRGAFGWYTAKPAPNAYNQWTHGTLGWGKDGTKYIDATRGFWANLFTDPRSHGCTRTDNESIAYIRNIVPAGTPLLKIYAKEGYLDKNRTGYSKDKQNWNYILTKNGVRVDGQLPDREAVLAKGTPQSEWLEEGTYQVDMYPDAEKFKRGGGKNGKNGNVYELKETEFQGVFLVDAGLLVDYRHPGSLQRGGYKDVTLPPFAVSNVEPMMP